MKAQIASVGSETLVNTTTANSQQNAKVAMDDNGNYLVVWESFNQDGSGFGVYGQWYNADGTLNGSEFQVNTITDKDQRFPAVAVTEDGRSSIVWVEDEEDGTGWTLKCRMYNSSHVATTSAFSIRTSSSGQQRWPDVHMDDSGNAYITWTQAANDRSSYNVYATVRQNTGTGITGIIQVNDANSNFNGYSKVGVEENGDFVIVWQSLGADTAGTHGIMCERFNATGTSKGTEFLVNTEITGNQISPDIAMDSLGNFTVVWTSSNQDGSNDGIYGQRYKESGLVDSTEFRVSTTTTGFQNHPSLGISKEGTALAVWNSYGTDGNLDGVYGQAYNADGSVSGTETLINTRTNDFQQYADVAAYPISNNFVVVWSSGLKNSSSSQDGNNYGVYAQRYTVIAPMELTLDSTNVVCNGATTGAVSVSVTGGLEPYTYRWRINGSTVGSTASLSGVGAGTYALRVIDANATTLHDTVTVTEPTALTLSASITGSLACNGDMNGELTASSTGGTGSYTYAWNTGETSAVETNLSAGTYSVTVTDANGCTDSTSISLTEPSVLVTSTVVTRSIFCNGDANGELTASSTGGTGAYTYAWNTGETSAVETNLSVGTYSVTVTDANGCTDSTSISLTEPGVLVTSTAITRSIFCSGDANGELTASSTGGTSPYTYSWNTGETSAVETNLAAGTYSVTVTDANGCTDSTSTTITEPTILVASTSITAAVTCNGATNGQVSSSATGGTAPYTYSWNTGETSAQETGLGAGIYSITITDANGCTDSASISLTEPSVLVTSTAVTRSIFCNGDANGELTASSAGGTGVYSYTWNTGGTSAVETNLSAGTYSVTITDANGCTDSTSISLTEPSVLVTSTTITRAIFCNGDANGELTASSTGGTGAYSYTWNAGGTSAVETGLSAGTYSVTVTDANGCTDSTSISLTEPSLLVGSIAAKINPSTLSASDGSATASAMGGTTPYTYLWSSGGNGATESGLSGGTYTISISDANGCTAQPLEVTLDAAAGALNFGGANDYVSIPQHSSLNLNNNFTLEFWFKSDDFNKTNSYILDKKGEYAILYGFAANAIEFYAFRFTGSDPRTGSQISILDNDWHHIAYSYDGSTFSGYKDGIEVFSVTRTFNLTANTSAISLGAYNSSGFFGDFTMDEFRIWNRSLCKSELAFNKNCESPGNTNGLLAYYNFNTGLVDGTNTGLTSLIDQSGNGHDGTLNNFSLSGIGSNWTATSDSITDGTCGSFTAPAITVSITSVNNVSISGGTDGAATAIGTGGSDYTYLWSNAATTNSISSLSAGTYSVTITDICGSTDSTSVTITEPSSLSAGALKFGGGSDYVSIPQHSSLNLNNSFTLEFWFKSDNFNATNDYILDKRGEYAILYGFATNAIEFYAFGFSGSSPRTGSQISILDNDWHHIAYSYDGSTFSGYKDGVEVFSVTRTFSLKANTSDISLGAYNSSDYFGDFTMDELRIWNRSLCQSELIFNKNCEAPGNTSGLVAYYDFNTGIADGINTGLTSLTDQSGNGHNGILNNFGLSGSGSNWTLASDSVTSGTCGSFTTPIITASINVVNNVTVSGGSDGAATAMGTGGINYTYLWSNAATTNSISGLSAGTYTVTITDICGGTDAASVSITEPSGIDAGALNFGGAGDYVSIPQHSSLNLNNNFTIEFWFKSDNFNATNDYILDKNSEYAIIYGFVPNAIEFYAFGFTGSSPRTGSQISILDNDWHHIAYSYDGSTFSGYKDGVEVFSLSRTFNLTANTANLSLGGYNSSGYFGDFTMDELRIWNRSLCENELAFNKNCEAPGKTNGLVAYYDFNTGIVDGINTSFTSLIDRSGNGHNGTLNNFNLSGLVSNWTLASDSITGGTCGSYTGPAVMASISSTNISINGGSDGAATAMGTGGSSYTYLWSTLETTSSINSLSAGTYSVTITDLCGGTDSASVTITEPSSLSAGALNFGGAGDYVSIPQHPFLNLNNNFTLEFWFKADDFNATRDYILDKNGEYAIIYGFASNAIEFYSFNFTGSSPRTGSQISILDNEWHHIAYSYDGVNFAGYKDGVEVFSVMRTFNLIANTDNISLGGYNSSGYFGDFTMDELRIWNRSLCQAELAFNKNCEAPGATSGLLAYYDFNEGVVDGINTGLTSLVDRSGNGHNGTLHNFGLSGSGSNWTQAADSITGGTCGSFISPVVNVSIVSTDVSVVGGSDGTATAIATGGSDYTYLWSTSATTSSIDSLSVGTYTVTVTDICGTTDSASVNITEPSLFSVGQVRSKKSALEAKSNTLVIYPNPAKNSFVIELDVSEQYEVLNILDLTGALVKSVQVSSNKERIDISSFAKGTYIIQYGNFFNKLIVLK